MIDLMFLGTTCMVPTKERNHPGLFLSYREEGLLFDCGEGIQRQFKAAGLKLTKLTKILISHWHGDHVLGLPGIIQSLGASDYSGCLDIYGPKGTKERMGHMEKAFLFDRKTGYRIHEVSGKLVFDSKYFAIEAFTLEHGIKTLGYVFIEKDRRRVKMPYLKKLGIPEGPHIGKLQEGRDIEYKGRKIKSSDSTYIVKGKKIAIISDTVLCDACFRIAEDADLLVCEASFTTAHEDKAKEYLHMTARQAAQIASQSNAKRLVLTHFSPRYKDMDEIRDDAASVFRDVELAYDFMKIRL